MRKLLLLAIIIITASACNDAPKTIVATVDNERSHPATFLRVNYEVRKNLVGKKIIEGVIINTGKHLSYNAVTLKIESYKDDDVASVTYTIPEMIAPGGQQTFKFKPEGAPDRIKVSIATASAD